MAQRADTKNLVPSNAMADLSDNTLSFDEFMNSTAKYVLDRFGQQYKSKKQILAELEAEIANIKKNSFLSISGGTVTGDTNFTAALKYKGNLVFTVNGGAVTGETNFTTALKYKGNEVAIINNTVQSISKEYQNNALSHFKKLGVIKATQKNMINKFTLLIAGSNKNIDKGNGVDLVTFSYDGSTAKVNHQIIVDSAVPSNRAKYGWYYNLTDEQYELWGNFGTYRGGVGISLISALNTDSSVIFNKTYMESGYPQEISYADPVLTITTENIASYQSGLGIGQTWQDVASSRALKTTYTNTTGKPIQVIIYVGHYAKSATVNLRVTITNVDGSSVLIKADAGHNYGNDYGSASLSINIPHGASYLAESSDSQITSWAELR